MLEKLKGKLHRLLNDYRPIIDEFTRAASNGVNSSYVGGTICSRVTKNFSPGTYCDDPYRFTLGEFHLKTSCFFPSCAMICSPIKTHTYNGRFLYLYRLYLAVSSPIIVIPKENMGIRFFTMFQASNFRL